MTCCYCYIFDTPLQPHLLILELNKIRTLLILLSAFYKIYPPLLLSNNYCPLLLISIPCALKCTWRISEFADFDQMMRVRRHLMKIKALTLSQVYNTILAHVSGFQHVYFVHLVTFKNYQTLNTCILGHICIFKIV